MKSFIDLSKLSGDGIIIRRKKGHTILIRSIAEAFYAKNHVSEKISIIAVDAIQNKAQFVKIEQIDHIHPMEMEDLEVWHAVKDGNNYYAVNRIG